MTEEQKKEMASDLHRLNLMHSRLDEGYEHVKGTLLALIVFLIEKVKEQEL